jgi:hypothetical protein
MVDLRLRREDWEVLLVGIYLIAVAVTTGISGSFGPLASVIDSLPGIGLVIAIRNRLQDYWYPKRMILMLPVIALGGVASVSVNLVHPLVAAASFSAFLAANLVATFLYRADSRLRLVLGIVCFAIVDSFIFPAVAFDRFTWWVVAGQIAAKILGGFAWSWVFLKYAPR